MPHGFIGLRPCLLFKEDGVLFSCDCFGSHLAMSDLFVEDEAAIYEPIKRYYAEIMMPFRSNVRKTWIKSRILVSI